MRILKICWVLVAFIVPSMKKVCKLLLDSDTQKCNQVKSSIGDFTDHAFGQTTMPMSGKPTRKIAPKES